MNEPNEHQAGALGKAPDEDREALIVLIESTANMLRGMCMDPRIPRDTKEALWSRVRQLDAASMREQSNG